jgi:peptide/nickel transport system permease protein
VSTTLAPESAVPGPSEMPPVAAAPGFAKRLLRRPLAVVCILFLAALVVVAIVAPIVLPDVAHEHAGDLLSARQGPSAGHLLGTDTLGRDVLQRLLVGTRVTLLGVAEALIVILLLGLPLGLAAGYFGGATDRAVTWIADLAFSVPAIVIVIVVVSVFPLSMTAAMIAFGVLAAPALMRVVRASTLAVREELYIAAARVGGLSHAYIIRRHVLPRIAGPVIVQTSLLAAVALLMQTGLAFLGLVVAPPAPSWGGMVAEGVSQIALQPWLIWPPGIAIALTILALGLLGDAVRDASSERWAAPVRRRRRRSARPRKGRPAAAAAQPVEAGTLLSIQHLCVTFPTQQGTVRVVDDVSFEVGAGETVGLVGESGCGKTGTAMAMIGLLPGGGRLESGHVVFDGRDLAALGERRLRQVRGKEIGVISQEPMISLDPVFRIGRQLAEAVRQHQGCSRSRARERALELLRKVQLPDPEAVARRYPHEISGGMAQRVAIARALAGEPKLLIADEPTTALDVTVQAEILELLRELQRERAMAILLVTHDWGVVADICDRAVVMYAGQVVERAPLAPMIDEPLHPYTAALLDCDPHAAAGAEVLPTIPGSVPSPFEWPAGCRFYGRCGFATAACAEAPVPLLAAADGRKSRCIHHDRLRATR